MLPSSLKQKSSTIVTIDITTNSDDIDRTTTGW